MVIPEVASETASNNSNAKLGFALFAIAYNNSNPSKKKGMASTWACKSPTVKLYEGISLMMYEGSNSRVEEK